MKCINWTAVNTEYYLFWVFFAIGSIPESLQFVTSPYPTPNPEKKNSRKNVPGITYLYVKPLFYFVILD